MHLRLPAAHGNIDEPVGSISVKAVLNALLDARNTGKPVENLEVLLRPVPAVHESADVLDVLALLKRSPAGMAFVVDEFGGLAGVITAADILESIAGRFALPGSAGQPEARQREDGSWLIDGSLPREDMSATLGLEQIGRAHD